MHTHTHTIASRTTSKKNVRKRTIFKREREIRERWSFFYAFFEFFFFFVFLCCSCLQLVNECNIILRRVFFREKQEEKNQHQHRHHHQQNSSIFAKNLNEMEVQKKKKKKQKKAKKKRKCIRRKNRMNRGDVFTTVRESSKNGFYY